jgi:hypothetical protein
MASIDIITPIQAELLRAAGAMVAKKEFDHLLYIGDLPLPEDLVRAKSTARKKLVQAVTNTAQQAVIEAMGVATLTLPTYDIARRERFKIAIVGGIASGLFKRGDVVVAMIGRGPTSYPDTLFVIPIGDEDNRDDTGFCVMGTDRIPSPILESVIDLAVEIARDGWEGRPLGTLLVLGDSAAVMEKSRQLTLNPFQGYSEAEKNILNPEVRDAIKNFAVLDGAFVIREDGVVLAAGRYLKFDEDAEFDIPLGLGARHMAAAGVSKVTEAIAVVVSETSGVARVFQEGNCVLDIHPEQRGRRAAGDEPVEEVAEATAGEAKESKEPRVAAAKDKATKESKAAKEQPKSKDSKSKDGKK